MSRSKLRQTKNYLWSEDETLGKGAAGQVFVAYRKASAPRRTSQIKVAAKVLIEHRSMQREVEALRSLTKHKNIVNFFDVEAETTSGYVHYQVVFMELCNAGSLYEVIENPENCHGLDEAQFKSVLSDVAGGLHHLKNHGIAHRDIKPGNIMRCQLSDGSYIFKLADFGAARNVDLDDGAPKSIVGTPEYLHPYIYDSYLSQHSKSAYKGSAADLWSVGATYYHSATGKVPFRAFRLRADNATMLKIIKEKPSGAVAGWQERDGGPIKYDNHLPVDTLISSGLKLLITPVLAGLLETIPDKVWDFARFYREIQRITEMKVIDVFCVSHCSCHKIYIDRKLPNCIQHLKEQISRQTRLDPKHMELFYENLPYPHSPGGPIPADHLPQTTPYKPITVLGGEPHSADKLEQPPLLQRNFIAHEDDIVLYTKECLKTLCGFRYSCEMLDCCFQMMHQSAHSLGATIHHEYSRLKQQTEALLDFHEAICWMLQSQVAQLESDIGVVALYNVANERVLSDLLQRMRADLSQKRERITEYVGQRESIVHQLRQAEVQSNGIRSLWKADLHTESFTKGLEKVMFYVQAVKKLKEEAESLQKKHTAREHNQLVVDHIRAQLSEIYSNGQEKILQMQEIRSDVHSRLYVFLNNCNALREEINTFGRELELNKADCKKVMHNLQKWVQDHHQRMTSIRGMMAEKLNNCQNPSSSSQQLRSPEMKRLLAKLSNCTIAMNTIATQQRRTLDKL